MKKYNVIFIAFLLAIVGSISVKAQEDRTHSITNPTSWMGIFLKQDSVLVHCPPTIT